MLKALVSVACIGTLCVGGLVSTNLLTEETITANRQQQARTTALSLLAGHEHTLPRAFDLGALPAGDCTDWVLHDITVAGYAGPIHFMGLHVMGLDGPEQLSLRVTAHRETPGIGDFIDHRYSEWLPDLDGISPRALDSLDSVTGATITFRAAQNAFNLMTVRNKEFCSE